MTANRRFPSVPKHTPRPVARAARAASKSQVAAPAPAPAPRSRLRVLPAIMVVATIALGLKVTDLFDGSSRVRPDVAIGAAMAQQKPAAAPAAPAPPSADAQKKDEEEEEDTNVKTDFTRAEVELLQQLSERRVELDRREKDIELRDNLLRATEKRIEEKIAELKKIEGRIDALLKKHDEQEEQRLQSVVKIYETMKPKDAAKVMERLDMPILLDVAERMKTGKMAAIMAEMDTTRARAVTTELATRRRLPTTGG